MKRIFVFASGVAVASARANPIRKVVTLLQEMQQEIEAEIEKEKNMHEKFQCYCKNNDGDLTVKAAEAAEVIKRTQAEVGENTARKKELQEAIKTHKKERAAAEKSLKDATKKREEEKSKYNEATADERKTIDDLNNAIAALEKGMGKSFLQTGASAYLKQVVASNTAAMENLTVSESQTVMSFLQGDYHGQGGEIVGILKMMKENFDESLGGLIGAEEAAVKAYLKLKATLEALIKSSGAAIESKTEAKGAVAVKIVEGKNTIATTEKQMGDDMATLAQLKEACKDNGSQFASRQADAAAEVDAIGQAIGVLNNDDALQLFHNTDTKALNQVSLLQASSMTNSPVNSAMHILNQKFDQPAIAMLAFAAKQSLKSGAGKVDFSKVLKMIDDMVVLLKREAEDDLKTRDNCNASFNESAAEKKDAEHAIAGLEAKIEELSGTIEAQSAIMAKADSDIAGAQQAQAEATEQRKAENAEYVVANDLNRQAVELIGKAKNKLNKFYNPQMYQQEDVVELTREEEIEAGARTVLVQEHVQNKQSDLPEGAPVGFEGGMNRNTKGQKSNSVMALMDMIVNDLNKDTQAMEHDEATAQKEYERLSTDLATQIAESQKAKAEATTSKTNAEEAKLTAQSTQSMKEEELADINQTIADLHSQCDFILAAFEERKAARETEISGLQKAKAILAGAKFD